MLPDQQFINVVFSGVAGTFIWNHKEGSYDKK
jgi:hypothetical protein